MKVYKLTDENMRTRGGYQWVLGEPHKTDGTGNLCGPGWLHHYSDPLLALFHNPVHADFRTPRLFEAKALGKHKRDGQMKGGSSQLTLVRELTLSVTTEQRVRYAIACAASVYQEPAFLLWAKGWLNGTDRSAEAAWAAARAAEEAAWAAAEAAWAAWAAWAAARAAPPNGVNLIALAAWAVSDSVTLP